MESLWGEKRTIFTQIWDNIRIRAVCDNLGYSPEEADLYTLIHNVTHAGQKGAEVFELQPGEDLAAKLGFLVKFAGRGGIVGGAVDYLERLCTDSDFREEAISEYRGTFLPRYQKYDLGYVIKTMKHL